MIVQTLYNHTRSDVKISMEMRVYRFQSICFIIENLSIKTELNILQSHMCLPRYVKRTKKRKPF